MTPQRLVASNRRITIVFVVFVAWTAVLVGYFEHGITNQGRSARKAICLQVEALKSTERARLVRSQQDLKKHRAEYIRRFGLDVIHRSEQETAARRRELAPVDCNHPIPPPRTARGS